MDLEKYLKINKLSYRRMAQKLNDSELRKKFNLALEPTMSHTQIRKWAKGLYKPSLVSMKILQTMTHGKVTMKDFLVD